MNSETTIADPIQILNGYWQTSVLFSMVQLNLPQLLAKGPLNPEAIAQEYHWCADGLRRLLYILCSLGWCKEEDGFFSFTHAGKIWFDPDSPEKVTDIILHHIHLAPRWFKLHERIINPQQYQELQRSPETHEIFIRGMANLATRLAPIILEYVDLYGSYQLLDLGGGPGTYAISFCQRWHQLHAIIFDLPQTRPIAEEMIQRSGLSDRIQFISGDFLTDPLPSGIDTVWVSHIIHSLSPKDTFLLLKKIYHSLSHGGVCILHDFFLHYQRTTPLFSTLFNLNMYINTSSGQTYTYSEVQDMLTEVGFSQVEYRELPAPSSLLWSKKR